MTTPAAASRDAGDAEVAIAAAEAGAQVLRGLYGGTLTRFAKSATDFATNADLAAEGAIREVIRTARPEDAFEGEEGGLVGPAGAARTWLVDPLCGTLNFAARTPLVAVNVALSDGARIVAAAVADPFARETFWTDGRVAFALAAGEALSPEPASRLVDVDFDRRPAWAAALVSSAPFTERFATRVSSSSLALTWVASGRRAAYVYAEDARGSVHFSAGVALCLAAGCVMTDLAGEPVGTTGNGLIAAADAGTHAALVAAAARAGVTG